MAVQGISEVVHITGKKKKKIILVPTLMEDGLEDNLIDRRGRTCINSSRRYLLQFLTGHPGLGICNTVFQPFCSVV